MANIFAWHLHNSSGKCLQLAWTNISANEEAGARTPLGPISIAFLNHMQLAVLSLILNEPISVPLEKQKDSMLLSGFDCFMTKVWRALST